MNKCDKEYATLEKSAYKILIIENSEFTNNTITKSLKEGDYICDQAFNYDIASNKLVNNKYDFIILDLNILDVHSEEVVEDIQRLSDAKIIVLTAETDIQSRENLFKKGILDYLVKDKYFNESIAVIHQDIQAIEKNITNNILIIDNSESTRKDIERILKVKNYNTFEAENFEQALELLKSEPINLVILDIEHHDKRGLDTILEIKTVSGLFQLPIIVISGSDNPEIVRNYLKLGTSDFIKKPFNVEEFVLKVNLAVESNRKNMQILCKQQLLNEYKEAVDRSTIVSKTDLKGNITYVNNMFAEISGYTKEELVGKPHNIVRHEDMSSKVFEDLWKTIGSKKSWSGIVKNRAKNGQAYYVDTVISPIVDYNGNIVEYIGIRTDITEIETMKGYLEDELNIAEGNFKEMFKLSSEYEQAIDRSTILYRSDNEEKITYANQAFCDISGYTLDELIGETSTILRHPENEKKLYEQIKETIDIGKVWSGQLRNIAKDGSSYYSSTTIVPIKDTDNNVIEHMSISHDMTEFVNINIELEEAQEEMIHKMGEVGETRSRETGFHVKRVAEYSKLLARLSGMSEENTKLLYSASPMHDIGKVGISDGILKKPGKLDNREFNIMKTHSKLGYNILKNSKRHILKAAAIVAITHHEKWDGTGYPNKLAGEKIHIFGRITAIADVFDALGSDRYYKKAWKLDRILELFKEEKEKHFDPKLVDIFLENIDEFLKICDRYKDK